MRNFLRGWLRRPSVGAVLGFIALVVALGGVGYASIPAADGQIHGCYLKPGLLGTGQGQLRVVDHDKQCARYETRITWSQQGPKGDKGDKGDPCLPTNPACVGPKGDKGEQGPPGPSTPPASRVATKDSPVSVPAGQIVTVLSIDLPPGGWVVAAKGEINNFGASCSLRTGEGSELDYVSGAAGVGASLPFSLVGQASLPAGGKVNLLCAGRGGLITHTQIVATSVSPI